MYFKYFIIILTGLFHLQVMADSQKSQLKPLGKALDEAKESRYEKALEKIEEWTPTDSYQSEYKTFWRDQWAGKLDQSWDHYLKLKKDKKFLRIRLEIFNNIIRTDIAKYKESKNINENQIKKEARVILRQLSNTSEGEVFESEYLKWLQKNKFFDEICKTERKRWYTQPDLDFMEMMDGIENCPIKFDEFIVRLRRLIFAAKESQAQREIDLYIKTQTEMKEWEKTYIRAVFSSNVGNPLAAFESLIPYEKDLLDSDYAENYFFISQRAGQVDKSEKILDQIISLYKKRNKKTTDLVFQKAFLKYQTKKYGEAFKIFDQLYKTHPKRYSKRKNKNFEQIAWLRAWNQYLDGNYSDAMRSFQDMKSYTSDSVRLAYWTAMTAKKMNQGFTALQLFKQISENVINNETFGYYHILSWLRYRELKKEDLNSQVIKNLLNMTKSGQGLYPVPSENTTRSQVIDFYSQYLNEANSEAETDITAVNDENEIIFSDEDQGIVVTSEEELKQHIEWASFLIEEKQQEFAKWHLYEIEKNLKYKASSRQLIQFYFDNEFYYRALSLSQRQLTRNRLSFDKDMFLLKFQYPLAYEKFVNKYSEKRKIDPYYMLSIMKAETQYKSDAISPVGAVGLMQFMPYTAEKVASLLGETIKTEELFDPVKSIEYGAAYLKKLFIEFKGQPAFVAAAYNGGPHRVKSWLQRIGQVDTDIFIEHIPFEETRSYVKKVLTYKTIFEKIYGKSKRSERLNEKDLEYLIKPYQINLENLNALQEEWEPFRSEI